jgi:hypothetical protein
MVGPRGRAARNKKAAQQRRPTKKTNRPAGNCGTVFIWSHLKCASSVPTLEKSNPSLQSCCKFQMQK